MSDLDQFLLRCAVLIGVPCFVLSVIVAQLLTDFTWQGVVIGTLAGMVVAVPWVCRVVVNEHRTVTNALVETAGQILMSGLRAAQLEIDQNVIGQNIERISRKKLEGKIFFSLDCMAETAVTKSRDA